MLCHAFVSLLRHTKHIKIKFNFENFLWFHKDILYFEKCGHSMVWNAAKHYVNYIVLFTYIVFIPFLFSISYFIFQFILYFDLYLFQKYIFLRMHSVFLFKKKKKNIKRFITTEHFRRVLRLCLGDTRPVARERLLWWFKWLFMMLFLVFRHFSALILQILLYFNFNYSQQK